MRDSEAAINGVQLQSRCLNSSKGWRCNGQRYNNSTNLCQKHYIQQLLNPKPPNFTIHQIIEVTSNEEAFKSSWFKAKILKILPNKNQFLIQYTDLLSDYNGVDGLVKIVDSSLIRPNPPLNPSSSFEIHQIVDAYHCDGWWKGEVVEYLEEEDVYRVYFDNWDEESNFGVDELRVHQIWVGGNWVTPRDTDIDVIRDEIDSEWHERKRKTHQSLPKERPWKKMQKEGAREGSSSEVPARTMLVTTRTELCTTNCMESDFNHWDDECESEEEAFVQNKKDTGGHYSTNISTKPSVESSDNQTPNVSQKDGDFPFIKSLPLWKIFETMEVFLSMPQKPHFRPLAKVNKSLREGTAIGYMASFVTVVENTRNAQLGAPICDYVEAHKALKELEDIGFDVQLIRARLDKLVSIKTATLKLDEELKQVESQITKDKLKEDSLHLDISEMDKKISELQERSVEMKKTKQVILMKRLAKDSNITVLQKSIQATEEDLHDTVLHFNCAAACPW
ncbi:hypothetical protein ACHQM5_028355 [Ranunculus cassubicifolius]